ncbi:hypothetical protein FXO38_01280 [Capsicum annuum]|nr:hypothetical protein FXO37_09957 [Capsicum annuum]KAF3682475.1 hypothetical protein FXO38_01280 [Capsicum annuum]
MTNSGENSVLPTHPEPVLNQPISTAPPSSIRQLVVHTSLVPSNTTSIDPDEYPSSLRLKFLTRMRTMGTAIVLKRMRWFTKDISWISWII